MENQTKKTPVWLRVIRVVELIVCVLLLAVIVVNVTLIVKSYVNPVAVPDFFGYKPFIVLSGSMEPEILAGDIVVTKKVAPEDVAVGDVISFRAEDDIVVTHRVVEVRTEGGLSFLTKGDANTGMDAAAVLPESIEGLYIWRAANVGSFAMFIQTPLGMLLFVITPLCLFFLYDLVSRNVRARRARAAAPGSGKDSSR